MLLTLNVMFSYIYCSKSFVELICNEFLQYFPWDSEAPVVTPTLAVIKYAFHIPVESCMLGVPW